MISVWQVITKRWCGEEVTQEMIYFFLTIAGVMRVYLNICLGYLFQYVPQVIHSLGRIQVIYYNATFPY